ncbi:MAG TPA: UDP-3-O-(3-hydroxymyristoyl)glucosamine N-acyltransferase [Vicinamibacteria bacterium]|jgi:UDP-3-O-[3-hydroxymyristoyl] glucosamine N-acyltransferase
MILRELAAHLDLALRGNGDVEVLRVAALDAAGPGDLSFLSNPRFLPRLQTTRATAVIVPPEAPTTLPSLVSSNPYLAYARATRILHPAAAPPAGVHPTAAVDPGAQLGEGVHVGAFAVVGPGARVGPRTVLHPHVVLYEGVAVGADCVLHSGVHVREGCRLGDRVVVQNGAVIGADGFGFAKDQEGRYHKIPQVGVVVIEDDVEIGALCAVDRAALHETRVGRGTKLDNLVQVGHSVAIGRDCVVAGQAGIAGSATIGDRVVLAGQVGVVGHLAIGDDVVVTAQSGIPGDVAAGSVVSGSPAFDNRTWLKATALFAKLPELQRRLRALERRLGEPGGEKP